MTSQMAEEGSRSMAADPPSIMLRLAQDYAWECHYITHTSASCACHRWIVKEHKGMPKSQHNWIDKNILCTKLRINQI